MRPYVTQWNHKPLKFNTFRINPLSSPLNLRFPWYFLPWLISPPSTRSFDKYILSSYYVLGTVLGTWDTSVYKARPLPSWSRYASGVPQVTQPKALESVPDIPSPVPLSYEGYFHLFLMSYHRPITASCLLLLHSRSKLPSGTEHQRLFIVYRVNLKLALCSLSSHHSYPTYMAPCVLFPKHIKSFPTSVSLLEQGQCPITISFPNTEVNNHKNSYCVLTARNSVKHFTCTYIHTTMLWGR